jgi:hypothetical protein
MHAAFIFDTLCHADFITLLPARDQRHGLSKAYHEMIDPQSPYSEMLIQATRLRVTRRAAGVRQCDARHCGDALCAEAQRALLPAKFHAHPRADARAACAQCRARYAQPALLRYAQSRAYARKRHQLFATALC